MKPTSESKENLVTASSSSGDLNDDSEGGKEPYDSINETDEYILTPVEKKFLLTAERGDCAGVRRIIEEFKDKPDDLDLNCVDPLNRSALIAAIENENIELIRLLLEEGIQVKDALLHAIDEEYVEAVETLLYWEEDHHEPGQPYTWEAVDRASSTYTPDITPLILAAHRNNYEILKILLDRGATLPMPHDVRCGCDECITSSATDSLRHSQSRINAYRALSASSLIALSSRDPLLTAFELSWELRRLSRMETEFRTEYNVMRQAVQEFSTSLLDHSRTSHELEVMLNFNPIPGSDIWEPGDRQTLERLKLAIKYKQKQFVAHPNVQQLLAAIWYDGLPGFRRKAMVGQLVQVAKLGCMFPVYSSIYLMAPNSEMGKFMKKPFVKFISHSTSYAFFLMLLGAASQRIEYLALEFIGTPWLLEVLEDWKRHERGSFPGPTECSIILYIVSLVFGEMQSLYNDGLMDYIADLWNIVDIISNMFYVTWIGLRFTSFFVVQRDSWRGLNPWYPREQWDPYDPMLLSEGVFAAGMIFSFLKLVHIFSINPHLGPLQVSLGRMIIDIIKFFFIYTLVLGAFGCGLNQLLWYYADLEKQKCYHLPNMDMPDFDNNEKACGIWRRFANLFETSQSLFWASFGLVDLMAFELQGIKSFTRFWAMLMFGSYSVINIIVLLNMLIAMMSNSYQIISERSDVEWKFARSQLWMSYFEDGGTVPPPFNLCPSVKMLSMGKKKRQSKSIIKRSQEKSLKRHDNVMRMLVRRYVTAEQRKRDDFGITEDDVMEIRQDISTLRYELIDILRQNGMKTPTVDPADSSLAGKKGKMMERRILKDFQIGIVEGIVNEVVQGSKEVKDVFSSIAKAIGKKSIKKEGKEDWNAIVRKNTTIRDPIGSTRASINRKDRLSLRRHILETANQGLQMDTEKLVQYNPKLSDATKGTRVAYVKFMKGTFKPNKDEVSVEDETKPTLSRTSSKAIVNFTASIKRIIADPDAIETVPDNSVEENIAGSSGLTIEEKEVVRSPTPIDEDPMEEHIMSPVPPIAGPSRVCSPVPNDDQAPDISDEHAISPEPSSLLDSPAIETEVTISRPLVELSPVPEADETDTTETEVVKELNAVLDAPAASTSLQASSTPINRSVTPTTERGKSTTTGKTISGWL